VTAVQHSGALSPQRYAYGKFRTRQSDGDWDYFPYAWLGRGYRVDATGLAGFIQLERGRWPAAIVAISWAVATVVFAVYQVEARQVEARIALLAGGAVAGLIWMAWFAIVVAWRTRRLPPAERPLTWTELRRWEASGLSGWRLLLSIGAAAAVAAVGFLIMDRMTDDPELDRVVLGTGLGLLSLAIGCHGMVKTTYSLWFRLKAGHRIPIR
jgi:hypothetical protein